jgi:Uri superfamily endonuclease
MMYLSPKAQNDIYGDWHIDYLGAQQWLEARTLENVVERIQNELSLSTVSVYGGNVSDVYVVTDHHGCCHAVINRRG